MEEKEDKEFASRFGDLAGSEAGAMGDTQTAPVSWKECLASAPRATGDFMDNVEELPQQEREMWKDAGSDRMADNSDFYLNLLV